MDEICYEDYIKVRRIKKREFQTETLIKNISTNHLYLMKSFKADLNMIQQEKLVKLVEKVKEISVKTLLPIIACSQKDAKGKNNFTILYEYVSSATISNYLKMEQEGLSDKSFTRTKRLICLLGTAYTMIKLYQNDIRYDTISTDSIILDRNYYPLVCDLDLIKISTKPSSNDTNNLEYLRKSNVYKFGILAFTILSGYEPKLIKQGFTNELDAPDELKALIEHCTDIDLSKRPDIEQIFRILSGLPCMDIEYSSYVNQLNSSGDLISNISGTISCCDNETYCYMKEANNGNINAECEFGKRLLEGKGTTKNISAALEYLKKSAENNNPEALYMLGHCYQNNIGVLCENKEYIKYYEKASQLNHPKAIYCYAKIKLQGENRDNEEIVRLLAKAAKAGIMDAQLELSHHYIKGDICEQDAEKFLNYTEMAFKNGSAEAAYNLYLLHKATSSDKKITLSFLEVAAERGHLDAMVLLGEDHSFDDNLGIVTNRDKQKGFQLIKKAADRGHLIATYYLGALYHNGIGVEIDTEQAIELYHKAADRGCIHAQVLLAQEYLTEGGLLPVDYHQSAKYSLLGAAQGSIKSKLILALLYRDGLGVQRDLKKSLDYFNQLKEVAENEDVDSLDKEINSLNRELALENENNYESTD